MLFPCMCILYLILLHLCGINRVYKWRRQGDTWARVSNLHGQTLLSLAFNYGILSLKTLTFGTDVLQVLVEDRPHDCMLRLREDEKINTVLHLLMRDFKPEENPLVHSGSYVRFYTQLILSRNRLSSTYSTNCQSY